MVQAQFESSQLRAAETATKDQSDSSSATLLAEVQVHLTKGNIATNDGTVHKPLNKEIDKIINGFSINRDEKSSDKSEIACRLIKGQTIEDGRLVPTVKDGSAKPLVPGRDGPTDQDRPSKFDLYLFELCNRDGHKK